MASYDVASTTHESLTLGMHFTRHLAKEQADPDSWNAYLGLSVDGMARASQGGGRGFHSSTSQPYLSRTCHRKHPYNGRMTPLYNAPEPPIVGTRIAQIAPAPPIMGN